MMKNKEKSSQAEKAINLSEVIKNCISILETIHKILTMRFHMSDVEVSWKNYIDI